MADDSRIAALQEILRQDPTDAFARYALGLEYSSAGATEAALSEFGQLIAAHPDYTNGYFMAAQTLERAGRIDEARAMLENGIESARRTNNRHALSEMEAMRDELAVRG
jgi:tetratricopeptide (TPR) repeat protein